MSAHPQQRAEEAYQGLLAHSNALEKDLPKLEGGVSRSPRPIATALREEYRRLLSVYTKSNKEHAGV